VLLPIVITLSTRSLHPLHHKHLLLSEYCLLPLPVILSITIAPHLEVIVCSYSVLIQFYAFRYQTVSILLLPVTIVWPKSSTVCTNIIYYPSHITTIAIYWHCLLAAISTHHNKTIVVLPEIFPPITISWLHCCFILRRYVGGQFLILGVRGNLLVWCTYTFSHLQVLRPSTISLQFVIFHLPYYHIVNAIWLLHRYCTCCVRQLAFISYCWTLLYWFTATLSQTQTSHSVIIKSSRSKLSSNDALIDKNLITM
jgi:hypothetical protein